MKTKFARLASKLTALSLIASTVLSAGCAAPIATEGYDDAIETSAAPSAALAAAPNAEGITIDSLWVMPDATGAAAENDVNATVDPALAKKIALQLAKQAAKKLPPPIGDLTGWGIDELFGGRPSNPQLDKIEQDIGAINSQLTTIQRQMAALDIKITDQNYQAAIQKMEGDYVSPLTTMWNDYDARIATRDTDKESLDKWANEVVGRGGVAQSMDQVVGYFNGTDAVYQRPLVAQFAQFAVEQGKIAKWDDRSAYRDVINPFTQRYVNVMLMGMTLEQEAYHQLGKNVMAQHQANRRWGQIRSMYEKGGYPVSNDKVISSTTGDGLAWARVPLTTPANVSTWSYSFRGLAPNAPLYRPLTAASFKSMTSQLGADELAWKLPTEAQLVGLWAERGNQTPAQYMQSVGFQTRPGNGNLFFELGPQRPAGNLLMAGFRSVDTNGRSTLVDWMCTNMTGPCTKQGVGGVVPVGGTVKWLGGDTGSLRGIPTYPGTKWLEKMWSEEAPTHHWPLPAP